MERKVRNLKVGEEKKHLETLQSCFDSWGDWGEWRRRYEQPDFSITENVIVVEENSEWIGGGTAWFRDAFLRKDKRTKVYIAGDGYVHPDHRGRGVYSTIMQSLNELARNKGASLGFGFISIYETPFIALPKYGFIDVFHPETNVLVLNPEKFMFFLTAQMKEITLPNKFENLRLKLTISFNASKRKHEVTKVFKISNGHLHEMQGDIRNVRNIDLSIKTSISTLLKIFRYLHFRKKTLLLLLFANFLIGRFRFRCSIEFVKMSLGLR